MLRLRNNATKAAVLMAGRGDLSVPPGYAQATLARQVAPVHGEDQLLDVIVTITITTDTLHFSMAAVCVILRTHRRAR